MLGSENSNRYNAYMKQTESGIIVKTIDSVTGVESLIKFTTDSIFLPRDKNKQEITKENIRNCLRKGMEANPIMKKKRRYYLSRKNPTSKTKLSNVRMYLKDIQPYIPDFQVYESKSTSIDFQNSNVVFVANSKLSKGGVVNLNIPGKLGNVYYHGNISESGIVKFKAKSVIKPFTIIIGDYVININITHNLTTAKGVQSLKESYNQNLKSRVKNHDSENFNNTETNIDPVYIDTTKSDKNTHDSMKIHNETIVDQLYLDDEKIDKKFSVKSGRSTYTRDTEIGWELKTDVSESTRKLNDQNDHSLNVKPSERSLLLDKNNLFHSSVDLSGNKLLTLRDESSGNIESKKLCPSIHCKDNKLTGKPCEDTEIEFSKAYEVSFDSDCLKLNKTSTSTNSISKTKGSKLPDENDFQLTKQHEIKSANDYECITRQNSKSSCISMLEIKKKLSEATLSLQKICSVIESLDELSKNPVIKETEDINQAVESSVDKTSLKEANSNASTTISSSKSGKYCLCNDRVRDECYKTGNNVFENKSNTGIFNSSESENTMINSPENNLGLSDVCIAKESIENNNYLSKFVSDIQSVKTENMANKKQMSGKKLLFHKKRKTQSLTHLFGSMKTNADSLSRSKAVVNDIFGDNFDDRSQTELDEGCIGCKPQRVSCDAEVARRDQSSTETEIRNRVADKGESRLAGERDHQTGFDRPLDSVTNFRQESLSPDPGISSYSTNSIRTIYINDGCTSSYYMTMPIQKSFLKPKIFSNDKNSNEDMSLTNLKYSNEKVSKSFGQRIKRKFSKMKTQLINLSAVNNKKEHDSIQLPEKNSAPANISSTQNILTDSHEHLVFHEEKKEPKRDLYTHNDTEKVSHGLGLCNTQRDCKNSKVPICKDCSIKSHAQNDSELVIAKQTS